MALSDIVTEFRQTPNISLGRPDGRANAIVIHHWGSDGQSHDNVVNWLCNPNSYASAHFVASSGRITQLAATTDRTWHAGPLGNPRGIGIECRPEMGSGDVATVKRLVAELLNMYPGSAIVGHRDFMPTECPGRWYPNLASLAVSTIIDWNYDMTPEQSTEFAQLMWSLRNSILPTLNTLNKAVFEERARDAAMAAALDTLSKSAGVNVEDVKIAIDSAVKAAMADIEVILTTRKGG